MRVRDLPIAGRLTRLVWRKRRYRCTDCGRTFTETHEQLPSRQRVTGRFRARLAERVASGAAHAEVAREERTSRYQVDRAFAERADQRQARDDDGRPRRLSLDEAHHRRGGELATVVSDLDRRRVVEILDGRDRRTVETTLAPDLSRQPLAAIRFASAGSPVTQLVAIMAGTRWRFVRLFRPKRH